MMKTTVSAQWNGADVKIRGKKVVGRTAFEVGLVVEGQAKLLCAVDSGRLTGSITVKSIDRNTVPSGDGAVGTDLLTIQPTANEVFVGTPVFYGPYVEFGTMYSDAQPFLRPSLDLAKGKVLTIGMRNGKYEFRDYFNRRTA